MNCCLLIKTIFILLQCVTHVCFGLSSKKGVALTRDRFRCHDLDLLARFTWWYDWGMNVQHFMQYNCTQLSEHTAKFVPMVWTYDPGHTKIRLENNSQPVLGFNEPNNKRQANIWPVEAAAVWPEVEMASKGRQLVSPSAAPCGNECIGGNTTKWLDDFFKHCQYCRIDFIATHFYSCNGSETLEFVRQLYRRYDRKVWLTEFACPHSSRPEDQLRYMKEVLPLLEEAQFVYRYSWFASRVPSGGYVSSSASLLQQNSSDLTTLGRFYVSFESNVANMRGHH